MGGGGRERGIERDNFSNQMLCQSKVSTNMLYYMLYVEL